MKMPPFAFVLVALSVAACGDVERPPSNPYEGGGGASLGTPASATGQAPATAVRADEPSRATTAASEVDRLAGSAGEVRGFASASPSVAMYDGGRGFRLTATDEAGRWRLMAQLDFTRPLTDPTWAPGTTRTIPIEGRLGSDAIRAIACSGPARDAYTFDSPPREITVQVSAGSVPEARVVTFTQTFADPSQTVSGTFEYVPR
jgi:hypothetical protein